MPTITKTPFVSDEYYIDFVNQVQTGETIALQSVTASVSGTGEDATAEIIMANPAPAVSGTQAIFWYQGGVAGNTYIVSVKVATSLGRDLEGDMQIFIVPAFP